MQNAGTEGFIQNRKSSKEKKDADALSSIKGRRFLGGRSWKGSHTGLFPIPGEGDHEMKAQGRWPSQYYLASGKVTDS